MTNQRKRPSPTGPAQDDHEGVQAAAGVIGATGAHRSNGGGWIGGDIRASAAHEQADDRSTLAFGRAAGGAMVGDGQDLTQGPAGERGIGSGWSTGSAATAGALANPGDESLMLSSSNSIQCSGPASASASASALSLSSSSSSPSLGSSGMSLADSDQDTVVMGVRGHGDTGGGRGGIDRPAHARKPDPGRPRYSHTFLVHNTVRASPLSKESPEQNFRGFFNLAMLLLGVSNLRLIVENFEKYGWLLNIPLSGVRLVDLKFMVLAVGCLGVLMLGSFAAELVAAQRSRNPSASLVLVPFVHSALIVAVVFVPSWIAWEYIWHPAAAFVPVFAATIVSLKLISFACVNSDMRREMRLRIRSRPVEDMTSFKPEPITSENGEKFHPSELQYPANLTLANFAYFAFAPTLCYQTSYPRTKRIRKVFLVKRVIELSTAIAGMYFLSVQYAGPTLRNSIEALDSMDVLRLSERILKLSIISVVIWLLMFWSLFHCWLNILAELLCFGDRRFYQPWWNAKDISEYWRLWNSPVYNWGKRHIYLPLILNCGVPPQAALAIVFCISALLHELLIAVPTHCFNGVAFLGMMGQVPLIIILNVVFGWCRRIFKRPKNDLLYDTIGNYIFWITFTIVGQPACVLLYYSQWYKKNAM